MFNGLFLGCLWKHRCLLGVFFFLLGISHSSLASPFFEPKPAIVVTIKPLALIASALTADDFTVTALLPPSANPHALSMNIRERQALMNADLVVWLGGGFERFLVKPMAQHQKAQLELGALANLSWPTGEQADLHIWLDIKNIKTILKALAPQLIALAPLKAPVIRERLAQTLVRLDQTHAHIAQLLEPYRSRPFIVSHDGYGHFVNTYGLVQSAAASRLPEEQLSARKMFELKNAAGKPACLIAEPNERAGVRLARSLGLPLVIADPLGRAKSVNTIDGLLLNLASSFVECLAM